MPSRAGPKRLERFRITFGDLCPSRRRLLTQPPETPLVRLCLTFGGDGAWC